MNPLDMIMKTMGIDPHVMQTAIATVQDAAARFERIEGALSRIELQGLRIENSLSLLLDEMGDTVTAAPTKWGVIPILNKLSDADQPYPRLVSNE